MSREMPILTLPKPALKHMLAEGRSVLELGVTSMFMPFLLRAPKGDNHPVMVLPGFLASDISTQPIRAFLKLKGYQTYGWGLGRNLGTQIVGGENVISDVLLNRVIELSVKHGGKVSLVGWSLGGILAREIARLLPDIVRQVITLGSPFNGPDGSAPIASKLFDIINGDIADRNPQVMLNMLSPPPVPTSAIYSRTDGVAHWQACMNTRIDISEQAENIEVKGSHLGLGHNHQVIWIVANRLAQLEGLWQPYVKNSADEYRSRSRASGGKLLMGDIIQHHAAEQIKANGLQITYDSFGDPADPAMILIMGLGTQMIHWSDQFCQLLASNNFRIIRFDNRDIGMSNLVEGLSCAKPV